MINLDVDQIKKLCKLYHTSMYGLNPVRFNKSTVIHKEIETKYTDIKTPGYYINLVEKTSRNGWNVEKTLLLLLTDLELNDTNNTVLMSIQKENSITDGSITENMIFVNGKKPIYYKNKGTVLNVNKNLTKEKFFESAIMSNICIDYEYITLALNLKNELQNEGKLIKIDHSRIDNDILKRTIWN